MQEKPKVLIVGKVRERVAERLEGEVELVRCSAALEPGKLAPGIAEGIRGVAVSGSFDAAAIGCLPNLQIIANFGVGYDGVDVGAAAARGIVVTNTPDVLNDEVADTAIALLLNTVRRFPEAETWLREGRWERTGAFPLSKLSLRGRSVGIYGLGRIGLEIARRLEGFGVSISYHTRSRREEAPYVYHPTLIGMAEAVDTLIAIVPKTPETYKTIDAGVLVALGPNGVLINVGRGWTVDEEALAAALEAGTIAAAGLDVFQDEPHVPGALLAAPNTCLLPHVASASVATRDAMADLVADNLLTWFRTGRPLTPVPETPVGG
ncbi:lactate dehydrogenase-like 2-hydroxyacid dehydrogenase [Rhizobium azooxidifex]|uniref:Lactate dehydrogenase-like 2-hydroxyacid dehydrogenase n=1 Tax=Mycoplana azooxidifex TaxID=1636188 RepID=A0A7W6D7F2_9HYPH|nr:2-hydroxyacid dehydrogenase [Mycoplana azooxidifex]MBB3977437.1 lactate dehydrogenase-like 2-hydroxyacid dehydrogenase [Mycoplana azooxidifex]